MNPSNPPPGYGPATHNQSARTAITMTMMITPATIYTEVVSQNAYQNRVG